MILFGFDRTLLTEPYTSVADHVKVLKHSLYFCGDFAYARLHTRTQPFLTVRGRPSLDPQGRASRLVAASAATARRRQSSRLPALRSSTTATAGPADAASW